MSQDWNGIQSGNSKYKAEIVQVGLEHSLATQYTSFVAVEERTVVSDGKPVKVEVPVELPEGVSPLAVPGGSLQEYAKAGRSAGPVVYNLKSASPPSPQFGLSVNETVEVAASTPTVETSTIDIATIKPAKDASRKHAEAKMSALNVLAIYRCSVARGVSTAASACKATSSPVKVTVDLTEIKAGLRTKADQRGTENRQWFWFQ